MFSFQTISALSSLRMWAPWRQALCSASLPPLAPSTTACPVPRRMEQPFRKQWWINQWMVGKTSASNVRNKTPFEAQWQTFNISKKILHCLLSNNNLSGQLNKVKIKWIDLKVTFMSFATYISGFPKPQNHLNKIKMSKTFKYISTEKCFWGLSL